MVLKLSWDQKQMFWIFENDIFQFCGFLSDEVETVFWESKENPSRPFTSRVGQRKLFRKWFETNLSSKGNVFNPWTCYFSALQRFERPSWKGKPSRPFSFKVSHSKHFRKWFWSYLEVKKECCEHSKKNAFQKNAFLEMLFSFYLTVLDNLY